MRHLGNVKYKNRNREYVYPSGGVGTPVGELFLPPDDATKVLGTIHNLSRTWRKQCELNQLCFEFL